MALIAGILTACAVIVSSFIQHEHAYTSVRSNVSKQQDSLVRQIAGDIDRHIRLLISLQQQGTQHDLLHPAISAPDARLFVQRQGPVLTQFVDEILVLNPQGVVLADYPAQEGRQGQPLVIPDFSPSSESPARTRITPPYTHEQTGAKAITLISPVFNHQQQISGYLAYSIRLLSSNLLGHLKNQKIGDSGYVYVISKNNRELLFHSNSQRIGEKVPEGRNTLLDKALSEYYEGSAEGENSIGLKGFFSFKQLETQSWVIGVAFPSAEAFGSLEANRVVDMLVLVGFAAIAGTLTAVLMHLLLSPLLLLRDEVQECAQVLGSERQINTRLPAELQVVAHSVNHLLAAIRVLLHNQTAQRQELQRHRDQLQQQVQERTAHLLTAQQEAEAANQSKTEFLTNITHELRTPMHAVLSFANLGLAKTSEQENPRLWRYFTNIRSAGERMLLLINDLLDLAKMETGRYSLTLKTVDLREMLDAVHTELMAYAHDKHIHLVIDAPQPHYWVEGDSLRLMQVARNLLSNAIKFSPEETTIVSRLSLPPDDSPAQAELLVWEVIDQGVGIPVTELESIFDKFVQSSLTKNGSGGTGLGLPICRELIGLHGGQIAASNNPEAGCTFRITLPRLAIPGHS